MPVDDLPIHDSVRHERPPAGCYNRSEDSIGYWVNTVTHRAFVAAQMSRECRQIGRKSGEDWEPLPECVGCTAKKDSEYILKARTDIDTEAARFMRADQRIV